jgi:hypothetical protein
MTTKRIVSLLAVALIGFWPARSPSSAAAPEQDGSTRRVFATAVTKDGAPVTDLTAADIEVKEGGKTQELTSVKLSTSPMRVHIIVSDAGTGAFQAGVLKLAQGLFERSELAFTSVLVQPERIMDFTRNGEVIGDAIQKLGRRGTAQNKSQVMTAIVDALKDITSPGLQPVLILLRIGNEDPSSLSASTIRETLRTTGTTFYVVSRSGASRAQMSSSGSAAMSAEAAQRQMDDAERADTALQLNLVLGDGSRDSGGYQQEIPLATAATTLERLAAEIKNRYEITYRLPAGAKPSDRLQVTTKRRNVVLRAPQKIAN